MKARQALAIILLSGSTAVATLWGYNHFMVPKTYTYSQDSSKIPVNYAKFFNGENKFSGGPVGLNTLAAATGEEEDTITDIHEPFLIRLGLLAKTPKGRVATEAAYRHLGVEVRPSGQQKIL